MTSIPVDLQKSGTARDLDRVTMHAAERARAQACLAQVEAAIDTATAIAQACDAACTFVAHTLGCSRRKPDVVGAHD